MRDIFWLMKKILAVTFRKRRNVILYFGLPLIGIFIAFLAYGDTGSASLKVGVVNEDHQQIANDTVAFLESLNNVQVVKVNESSINDNITSGSLDCVITIDNGFSQSILNGNPDHIQIVSIKGAQITSFVESYLYEYLDNLGSIGKAAGGDSKTFEKMYTNYQHADFKLSAHSLKDTSKNKDMTNQTIGFLLMIMLFSAGNFSEILIKEKENRTYFRLLSTPINAKKYVLANIAVNFLVMLVQIIVTIFFMTKVFHIDMNVPFWQIGIVLSLFAIAGVGLSLMIVSFASSSSAAGALQNLIITPTCMLAGCFWPVGVMPKAIQKLADFLPQYWTLDTISQLQQGTKVAGLSFNFLILIAFAAAFFLIASYKLGRNNSVKNFV